MRQLYIKQKVFSLSSKFSVKDELENEEYFVEGSFEFHANAEDVFHYGCG